MLERIFPIRRVFIPHLERVLLCFQELLSQLQSSHERENYNHKGKIITDQILKQLLKIACLKPLMSQ